MVAKPLGRYYMAQEVRFLNPGQGKKRGESAQKITLLGTS